MHEDQLDVTVGVARRLISEQFPVWADSHVAPVPSEGTVNAIFRVGDTLTARFPLQLREVQAVRRWLLAEAEAARRLLDATTFPTPEPIAIGEPGTGYPLPWSIQTWLPGRTATEEDPGGSVLFATDLARFIHEARAINTDGQAFSGEGRGGDLRFSEEWMTKSFDRSEALVDVGRLQPLWARLRDLPRQSPDVMTHGDLTPGNVLVDDGRLVGILDVGGLGPADPALDLVAGWHLLDEAPRRIFRSELGCDDLEWERGKAWALQQALGAVWYYRDSNPSMHAMGVRTIERILDAEDQ
jgi:aminoglycoside phosphotransferase (APT) family kinase protein